MLERVLAIVKLDVNAYREVDQEEGLTGQALIVAIVAALVGGLGGFYSSTAVFGEEVMTQTVGGWLTSALIGTPIGLAIGAAFLLLFGKMFGGQADFMGLFRSLGFASAPNALGFIPVIGGLAGLWTIVCGVVAVRESHGISTGQAVIVVLIPLIVIGILVALLAVLVGVALFSAFSGLAG
ncbi:MAG: hypothetical protein HKN46_09025 [Acidimicrobiia bacterium]|nr:hypothetical protein [Acidimicrobiia bacterium]